MSISIEHVNPFLKATMETYASMLQDQIRPGKPVPARGGYDIAGVIGISGEIVGYVSIGYGTKSALASVSRMIGEDIGEINPDVLDAVGEIANIVTGYAKKYLPAKVSISLPEVIQGGALPGSGQQGFLTFVVPFESALGTFDVVVTLKPGS